MFRRLARECVRAEEEEEGVEVNQVEALELSRRRVRRERDFARRNNNNKILITTTTTGIILLIITATTEVVPTAHSQLTADLYSRKRREETDPV